MNATKRQVEMLRHAVADNDGTRNYWGGRTAECEPLIALGLLEFTGSRFDMDYFRVTAAGILFVGEQVNAEKKRKGLRDYVVSFKWSEYDEESFWYCAAKSRAAAKYDYAIELMDVFHDEKAFALMRRMRVRLG